MASLDTTTKKGTAAVDEAIKAATNGKFKTTQALINQMLTDFANAKSGDDFLKRYCGINLGNADTGAITGSDAGGSKVKTSTSIVPNGTFDTSFSGTRFTKSGVTFRLIYKDNNVYRDVSDINTLTAAEKHIWQGLYSFWIEESLKLIEESYGYSFNDSDVKPTTIYINFIDDSSASYPAQTIRPNEVDGKNYIRLEINMHYWKDVDKNDPDGKHPTMTNYYYHLDTLIAHELTHAVMSVKTSAYTTLPGFIIEGMAQLTIGMDTFDGSYRKPVTSAVQSKDKLAKYLDDKADGLFSEDYVGGYILMRYLARQFGDLNISNGTKKTLLSGFYGDDSIVTSGVNSTIDGGAGNDTLTNTNYGTGAKFYGNNGNDLITTYNANNVLMDGGAGNDRIEVRGVARGVSVIGGSGNDAITLSGGNNFVKYASGEGNDTITGISASDTIKITGAEYEKVTTAGSKDVTLKAGTGSIVIKGGKNIAFQIDGTIKPDNNPVNVTNSTSNTLISGTNYNDTITNQGGSKVTISTGGGNDIIHNSLSSHTNNSYVSIVGGDGNDSVRNAWGSRATILTGAGKDTIFDGSWYTFIDAGDGDD